MPPGLPRILPRPGWVLGAMLTIGLAVGTDLRDNPAYE